MMTYKTEATSIAKLARECGAVHFSPPPMRAVRGLSFTNEQLLVFSLKLQEPAATALAIVRTIHEVLRAGAPPGAILGAGNPLRQAISDLMDPQTMLKEAEPERAPIAASGALLPACPQCGCPDVVATAPDWTDTGINAEVTCDRCNHRWQASFIAALLEQAGATLYEVASVKYLAGEVLLRVAENGEVPQSLESGQLVVLGEVL